MGRPPLLVAVARRCRFGRPSSLLDARRSRDANPSRRPIYRVPDFDTRDAVAMAAVDAEVLARYNGRRGRPCRKRHIATIQIDSSLVTSMRGNLAGFFVSYRNGQFIASNRYLRPSSRRSGLLTWPKLSKLYDRLYRIIPTVARQAAKRAADKKRLTPYHAIRRKLLNQRGRTGWRCSIGLFLNDLSYYEAPDERYEPCTVHQLSWVTPNPGLTTMAIPPALVMPMQQFHCARNAVVPGGLFTWTHGQDFPGDMFWHWTFTSWQHRGDLVVKLDAVELFNAPVTAGETVGGQHPIIPPQDVDYLCSFVAADPPHETFVDDGIDHCV